MVTFNEAGLNGELQNYIDGQWQSATSEDRRSIDNPASGETLIHLRDSTPSDVDEAVNAAVDAQRAWRDQPIESRVQVLFELKNKLEGNRDELAELLSRDQGKTLAEAEGEMHRAIQNVEHACGAPSLMQTPSLANAASEIDEREIRHPLGVFAAITPFNFPVFVSLWYLPYAIVTGNAILLKPSDLTPLAVQRMFELIDTLSLPDGLVQLVHGDRETVTAILEHDDIAGVSFVGSTPVAEHIYETAAAHGKRVQAQGGAKNNVVVTESADLPFAAEKVVGGAYTCMGERCLATDTAIVVDEVYDEFVDLVVDEVDEITIGPGTDPTTDMGPVITQEHKRTIENYIETGIEEGATLVRDGRDFVTEPDSDGHFIGPTVFGDVAVGTRLGTEEIFGPVLCITRVSDLEEAISVTNRSEFGNAACLYTSDGGEARRFRKDVDAGNIGVNVGTAAPLSYFHMGGRKDSFFGDLHAQGRDIIDFYTDRKTYIEHWPNE